MFERYDEPARRTLFFARHAASELRSQSIGGEHLVLGLIREDQGNAARVLSALPLPDLRKELQSSCVAGTALPLSVEVPFNSEAKRMLAYAAEEADSLAHRGIGPEHLLLGVLRDEGSEAAAALGRYGLRLHTVREEVRQLADVPRSSATTNPAMRTLIQQLFQAAEELSKQVSSDPEASMRVALLLMDIKAIQSLLDQRS
jgi:ATP-dependent Clp protease ATP-binding subunit ClpC